MGADAEMWSRNKSKPAATHWAEEQRLPWEFWLGLGLGDREAFSLKPFESCREEKITAVTSAGVCKYSCARCGAETAVLKVWSPDRQFQPHL